MNRKSDEEINFYDYWIVLVKRKKTLISIFLIPVIIVTIMTLSRTRYFRGECEISHPILPASYIVKRINGDSPDLKKILTVNKDAIKDVSLSSFAKKGSERLSIIIEAKTPDIIPQGFKDVFDHISNMPEIREEVARTRQEIDLKMKRLVEAKNANLTFLRDVSDMIKKRTITSITMNPADMIRKDAEISLEIMNLQRASDTLKARKMNIAGVKPTDPAKNDPDPSLEIMNFQKADDPERIVTVSISAQPSSSKIKQTILITGLLSFLTGLFVVFFLAYIERVKTRKKN